MSSVSVESILISGIGDFESSRSSAISISTSVVTGSAISSSIIISVSSSSMMRSSSSLTEVYCNPSEGFGDATFC